MEHHDRRGASVFGFFVATFVTTWALQIPAVWVRLQGGEAERYMPLAMLGVLCPMLVASWMSFRAEGRAGVRALWAPMLRARVGLRWYVFALLAPGLLLTGVLWGLRGLGLEGPVAYLPSAAMLVAGVVISIGEEVGWRGYALPRLQHTYGPFGASGMIGIAWTLWHIPMFFGQGISLAYLPLMFLFFTGGSLFMTWIYNGTRGSLLLAVLAHLGAHLNNSHAALPATVVPAVVHAIVYASLGMAVMAPALLREALHRGGVTRSA